MLSDSSASDSPIKLRRINKRALYSSDDEDSDCPIKKWKGSSRKRVQSSSSQSSSDAIAGPSKKKPCQVIPVSDTGSSSCISTDSDDDVFCRSHIIKEVRKNRTINSDTDLSSDPGGKKCSPKKSPSKQDGADSSSSEDGERCIICFKSLRHPMARPSNCNHNFHSECLIAWSKTSNTCPFDRVKYTEILIANSEGEPLDRHAVTTPPPQNHNADDEPPPIMDEETFCEVCLHHDREHEMLLCDRCEAGYHLDCLSPPLDSVPIGRWFCPMCTHLQQVEDFSNDDSPLDEDEMDELLRDAMNITGGGLLLNRRGRTTSGRSTAQQRRVTRTSRQNTGGTPRQYNNRPNVDNINQPSTSSSNSSQRRRRQTTSSRRRTRTARYEIELVTIDNTTVTVKLATNSQRKRRRRKKKSNGRRQRRNRNSGEGSSILDTLGSYYPQPLDIYGSRPQLEYFSGCEGGDELDVEDNRNARPSRTTSNLMQHHATSRNANAPAASRRKANINFCNAPVDLLSTIMDEQEKWHNPKATFTSNSLGDVTVVLNGQASSSRPMSSKTYPSGTSRNESNSSSSSRSDVRPSSSGFTTSSTSKQVPSQSSASSSSTRPSLSGVQPTSRSSTKHGPDVLDLSTGRASSSSGSSRTSGSIRPVHSSKSSRNNSYS